MENKQKREREEENTPISSTFDLKSKLLLALIVIAVVALGLLALNQFISWRYKAYFLGSPCELCVEFNPYLKSCFNPSGNININKNEITFNLTPTSFGADPT